MLNHINGQTNYSSSLPLGGRADGDEGIDRLLVSASQLVVMHVMIIYYEINHGWRIALLALLVAIGSLKESVPGSIPCRVYTFKIFPKYLRIIIIITENVENNI